ncbi:MAG: heme-binding protein, partial [Candidatus Zixiibacteriota bacterium]
TPGGPLYGVPFSSLGGGDIQPNGDIALGRPSANAPGLTGVPGGIPIFKDDRLAGGLGISGGALDFVLNLCQGSSEDESIALGALANFSPPNNLRGDQIFIDGIRFLYANTDAPVGNFTFTFADALTLGAVDGTFLIRGTPAADFPIEGEIDLSLSFGASFDFSITGGSILSASDVQTIIGNAVTQANKTRAAIRRPLGTPARVFVTVVDTNGAVLGIWRTPDATMFSFDVSAQKARTVIAFSRTDHSLGMRIRSILGISAGQELAVTCRAVGFLSQDFYPPGIDLESLDEPVLPGPLYQGAQFALQDSLNLNPFGNGITIFPGGCPLYVNGILAGAIWVSGDGVDQDDIIAFAGTKGFEPPDNIRIDNYLFDDIRLPYVKFPRRPEIDQ